MRDDYVSRKAVMTSLTEEYNRRKEDGGLKLAWIELAVNRTPGAGWTSVREGLPKMTNADLFLREFGIYATELWAMPEQQLLEWLNAPCDRERLKDMLSAQLNEAHNEGYDVGYWAGRRDYEQKWILCSEGLPKKDGRYQVTRYDYVANTEFIDILWYEKNTWWDGHSTGDYAVTAWVPLPEPYKGEH